MSIKIYNAFKWRGRRGDVGVLENLAAIRGRVVDRAIKRFAVEPEHQESLGKIAAGATPEEFRELEKKLNGILSGSPRDYVNYTSSASIFPDTDGSTYVVFHGFDSLAFGGDSPECFIDDKLWEDFHYQNSSDRPEKVSAKAWKQREKTWDKLMARGGLGSHRFCDSSFSFKFVDASDAWDIILKAVEVYRRTHKKAAAAK